MSRSKHLVIFTLNLAKKISRQYSLLRKDVLQNIFIGFLWKNHASECLLIWSQKLKNGVKKKPSKHDILHSPVLYKDLKNYELIFNLKEQLERTTRKSRTISMRCYNPSSSFMRAIYFRALRMSATIPFCGRRECKVCGKRQGSWIIQQLLGLNRFLE